VLHPFVAPDPLAEVLIGLTETAFQRFRHPEIAPLRSMGGDHFLLELFWGPTLAFKDHALGVLGQLFDQVLARQTRKVTVLGATSGDTGSAAIAACSGRSHLDVVILYPDGRVSDFQRRQMTTVSDRNVRAVAVDGTFDDCQDLLKQAFADPALDLDLVAVNSINFARIAAQAAYYAWAASYLGAPEVDFAVPSGNFGNAFSGWVARTGGVGIGRLLIANNENHGLADLLSTGTLRVAPVTPTISPSMDIAIPSNLERYLFVLSGDDASRVRLWQSELRRSGEIHIPLDLVERMKSELSAHWVDDSESLVTIKRVYEEFGVLIDPHTAVGWSAASANKRRGVPMVTLATADPAKFAPAVTAATGIEPPLPPGFEALATASERIVRIPNDYEALAALLGS
jgi:threonine synthase